VYEFGVLDKLVKFTQSSANGECSREAIVLTPQMPSEFPQHLDDLVHRRWILGRFGTLLKNPDTLPLLAIEPLRTGLRREALRTR